MRICETKLYEYEELSEAAKEKARDWYRTITQSDDWYFQHVIEQFVELLAIFGVTVKTRTETYRNGVKREKPCVWFRGFWSQGDGASFEGSYEFKPNVAREVRKLYPTDEKLFTLASRLQNLQAKQGKKKLSSIITTSDPHYCHEYTMRFETLFGGTDDWFTGPQKREHMKEFEEIMRDLARWLYRTLESEYEHQNSDEVVAENLISNEYEFTEEGGAH